MLTADHPLIQLLALIDLVWIDTEPGSMKRGGPKFYSEKTMFKVYVVSLLKQLWAPVVVALLVEYATGVSGMWLGSCA